MTTTYKAMGAIVRTIGRQPADGEALHKSTFDQEASQIAIITLRNLGAVPRKQRASHAGYHHARTDRNTLSGHALI